MQEIKQTKIWSNYGHNIYLCFIFFLLVFLINISVMLNSAIKTPDMCAGRLQEMKLENLPANNILYTVEIFFGTSETRNPFNFQPRWGTEHFIKFHANIS